MPNPPTYLPAFAAATMPPIPTPPPAMSLAQLRERAIKGDPVATAQLKALQSLAAGEQPARPTPRPATEPGLPAPVYAGPPRQGQPLTLSGDLNPLNYLSLDAGLDKARAFAEENPTLIEDGLAGARDAIEYNIDRAHRFAEENPNLISDAMAGANEALFGPPSRLDEQAALRGDPPTGLPPIPPRKPAVPDLNAVPPAAGPAGEPLLATMPLPIPARKPAMPAPPPAEPPLMPSRGGAPGPAGRQPAMPAALAAGGESAPFAPSAGQAAGEDSDLYRGLLEFGLATMAAGGQPGASALSSLGAGGMAALQGADARRDRRIASEAATRAEAREERTLDIKEAEAVTSAQLRLAEIQQRAEDRTLDRNLRRDLATEANELKKMIADATAGNTAALRTLQEQQRLDRVDNAAANAYARLVNGARMSSLTGELSPEQDAAFREQVAKLFPESSFAAEFGAPTAGGAGPDVYAQARDAITAGADPTAVRERLTSLGYDPAQL